MTRVAFYKDNDFGYSGFSVKGHSGYAESGSDIICAAVSSTAQLVINLLTDSFDTECDLNIDPKKAIVECQIRFSEKNNKKKNIVFGILDGYFRYISELCGEYPKNISYTLTERNGLS